MGWRYLASLGASGGVLLASDKRVVELIEDYIGYYSAWGGWCSKEGRGSYGVSLWKFKRKGWNIFEKHLKFEVGDGACICFWFDVWSGESPLCMAFPIVFNMAGNQQAPVSEVLYRANGVVTWNVTFTGNAQDWELEELAGFYS